MFTGLIEATGRVVSLTATEGAARLVVAAPELAGRWREGDSIAVNGVCLTAIPLQEGMEFGAGFAADLAMETLERTTLQTMVPGTVVNLELPTPAGSPLGGHVVQGHVDGTGVLVGVKPMHHDAGSTDWRLTLELPERLLAQVVSQGSITVDGISLTVAKVAGARVEIAIIPHTWKMTNLHTLVAGARVNVETDVLAKYAAQRDGVKGEWLTVGYLVANGY
jgi:riboflavin synthase